MWVVGATTATRVTRPSASIRWATCRPKVVLPAAGVAEARMASPSWSKTAAAAACCQARRGRPVGQGGRERPTAGGAGISYVTGRAKLVAGSDELKGAWPLSLSPAGSTYIKGLTLYLRRRAGGAGTRAGTGLDVPAGHAPADGVLGAPARDRDAAAQACAARGLRRRRECARAARGVDRG